MGINGKWFELNGDETLALDWPLDEDSHVWEIGGYEGRWAQQIWDKYHCNITIFEPQLWAVGRMKNRFKGIDKINIRPYGLWVKTDVLPMGNFHTDGASLVNNDGREEKQSGFFRSIYAEVTNFPSEIDVCLMNIEGGEYTLLPLLMGSHGIDKFKTIWVQFHPFSFSNNYMDSVSSQIFEDMKETHDLLWDCYPTAVAWRKHE